MQTQQQKPRTERPPVGSRRGRPTAFVHYTIYLPNGQSISSHETGAPYRFPMNTGAVIPGLEQAVGNMEIGETRRIQLTAAQAFGEHDPSRVRFAYHRHIHTADDDTRVETGQPLRLAYKGSQEQAYVRETQDEGVVFDLNHPLAGLDLMIDVTLVNVEFAREGAQTAAPATASGNVSAATQYRPSTPASMSWD